MAYAVKTNVRIKNKYKKSDEWKVENPILLAGEIGVEADTNRFKFGDGEKNWKDLSYSNDNYEVNKITTLCYSEETTNIPNELLLNGIVILLDKK